MAGAGGGPMKDLLQPHPHLPELVGCRCRRQALLGLLQLSGLIDAELRGRHVEDCGGPAPPPVAAGSRGRRKAAGTNRMLEFGPERGLAIELGELTEARLDLVGDMEADPRRLGVLPDRLLPAILPPPPPPMNATPITPQARANRFPMIAPSPGGRTPSTPPPHRQHASCPGMR